MKTCPRCNQDLPVAAFSRNARRPDGVQAYCKACMQAYRLERGYQPTPEARERRRKRDRAAYKANPEKAWESNLIRKYGVDATKYAIMLEEQNGACAICFTLPGPKRLHVDHCHRTGRVRGLLCDDCNLGIGKLKDDMGLLAVAAAYLQHGTRWASIDLTVSTR